MNIKSIGSKIKGNPKMVEGTVYSMLIICSISHFLNGNVEIVRNRYKNTITLITCKKGTKDKQTIFIGYLVDKVEY